MKGPWGRMHDLDLEIDLNSMDETGLPWAFVDEAKDPSLLVPGSWLMVGEGEVRAVAQVVDCDGTIVHVRPLLDSVEKHLDLLARSPRLAG
ncbi:MAG: hypothetical protein WCP28_15245 [Actinomycetes bacterium]